MRAHTDTRMHTHTHAQIIHIKMYHYTHLGTLPHVEVFFGGLKLHKVAHKQSKVD